MSKARPDQNQLGVVFVSHKAKDDGIARRKIYDLLVREMDRLGIPPTHLAGSGPGLPKRYATFERFGIELRRLNSICTSTCR